VVYKIWGTHPLSRGRSDELVRGGAAYSEMLFCKIEFLMIIFRISEVEYLISCTCNILTNIIDWCVDLRSEKLKKKLLFLHKLKGINSKVKR
jgi:uncharacterized membrane protein